MRAGFGFAVIFFVAGCQSPVASRSVPNAQDGVREASRYQGTKNQQRSRRGRAEEAAPGEFDFYLLNLSWSPEFCSTHEDSPECGRKLGFVVHGLWPQDANGNYPQHCSDAPGPSDPEADTDIFPTASLVVHEWETHGTCTGLSAKDYFTQVHQAYAAVMVPANIGGGNDANGVTPDNLLGRFAAANPGYPAGAFALSCGNNRLTAIEICLTKDLRPEACQGVRSCRANVVKVTPQS